MTTRSKTVEYAFPTDSSTLTADTQRFLPTLEIHLPEDAKVFRSVTLEMGCTDHVTAASSATSFAMELALLPEDPDELIITEILTHSGESSVFHVSRDVTSYFTDNWDGSSMEARVGVTVGANETNNHWAKLKITYEYDDASETHVKTIWYPIESTRALLTTTYQTVGGALAIPAIKGGASILPEHDIVVHQVWIELLANQGTASTTDFALDAKLVGDATEQTSLYAVEAALASPGFVHAIWDITGSDLDAEQALEAKVDGVTDRITQMCGFIGITYEYKPVGTTLVWNSLLLPAFDSQDQFGASTSARKTQHVRELWIEEPSTISLRPSAVFAYYHDNLVGSAFALGVQGQTPRSFAALSTGATMVVGQRMDEGGASGAGLSLGRGRNKLMVSHFTDAADAGAFSGLTGTMLVNYTSGVAPEGVGAHNQTRHFALGWFGGDATLLQYPDTTAKTPSVPEERWFLNAVALQAAWLATERMQALRIQVQIRGTEGAANQGAGWANVHHSAIASAIENWLRHTTADCTHLWRRWAGDPDDRRLDLESGRRWAILNAAGLWIGALGLQVTYHAIAKTVYGTITGLAGDGSGLDVHLSRSEGGENVLVVSTEAGGTYEAAWYDDTEPLIADVFEDDSHMGRSAPFYASGMYEPPPEPEPLVPTATTALAGIVQLATSSDVTAGLAVQASDTRLSDARTPTSHGSSHASDGSDPIPAATTSVRGTVELATDGESASGLAVQANDARLSNARTPSSHASSHASDGGDPIAAATTSVRGTVELATDGESASGLAVQANDSRLSNARTPSSHASSHQSGGGDSIKLDDLAAPDDNTDLDATSSVHGLLRKLSNSGGDVLSGLGTWIPSGSVIDVQTFTTPGSDTWEKPATGSMALVMVWGGGGGGAGGGDNTSANARTGGCGGGGGAFSCAIIPLSFLSSTETVQVGATGSAGTVSATNGGDGGTGGFSAFGGATLASCKCGAGGGGGGRQGVTTGTAGGGGGGGGIGENGSVGSATAGGPGGGPGVAVLDYDAFGYSAVGGAGCRGGWSTSYVPYNAEFGGGGGAGRSTGTAGSDGGASFRGGGGGGCGASYDVTGGLTNPSAGGASGEVRNGGGGGAAGTNAGTPTAGAAGSDYILGGKAGSGGGGGGADTNSDGAGAAGGAGGTPAGGGGGGGCGRNSTGGLGGAGGRGEVRVYVW